MRRYKKNCYAEGGSIRPSLSDGSLGESLSKLKRKAQRAFGFGPSGNDLPGAGSSPTGSAGISGAKGGPSGAASDSKPAKSAAGVRGKAGTQSGSASPSRASSSFSAAGVKGKSGTQSGEASGHKTFNAAGMKGKAGTQSGDAVDKTRTSSTKPSQKKSAPRAAPPTPRKKPADVRSGTKVNFSGGFGQKGKSQFDA
jgi:hypothetical protein